MRVVEEKRLKIELKMMKMREIETSRENEKKIRDKIK